MAASDGMLTAVMIVLSLNLVMFFVGYGIEDLGGTNPFNYSDNALSKYNVGNATSFDVPNNVSTYLPGGAGTTISPDTGLAFTDIFTSVKNWFVDTLGLGHLLNFLSGPKNLLVAMNLEPAAAWAITALWYGVTLFLLIAFIWGR